ncbi:unnamed protein product [Durusdinium trenchii]|uniref:RanBP2-type domain-containing protein n=1 Tax=Durusdinium trenchii TaxID=1381693 RepID=A0ABP0NEE0_9DINO
MGGFGALSNSHLANSVLVFGPQTDLTISHLRPGFDPGELSRMSENMRHRVREAVSSGAHFEYHVAIEEHLAYARRLPLPRSCIFIHPIEGRIARLLERVGILWPLLVRAIAREQRLAKEGRSIDQAHKVVPPDSDVAWNLHDPEENLVLGSWGYSGKLATCRISPQQLCRLCRFPPRAHDWFCSGCLAHNVSKAMKCRRCGDQSTPVGIVAESWRPSDGRAKTLGSVADKGHRQGQDGAVWRMIRRLASSLRGRITALLLIALLSLFLRRGSRLLKL